MHFVEALMTNELR
jgi:hypothetical protein